MELKKYKNEYGFERVNCPFCQKPCYIRKATKSLPDELCNLKKHIRNQAKDEALDFYLFAKEDREKLIPHLEYYAKHTSIEPEAPKRAKRSFDRDLLSVN